MNSAVIASNERQIGGGRSRGEWPPLWVKLVGRRDWRRSRGRCLTK